MNIDLNNIDSNINKLYFDIGLSSYAKDII